MLKLKVEISRCIELLVGCRYSSGYVAELSYVHQTKSPVTDKQFYGSHICPFAVP